MTKPCTTVASATRRRRTRPSCSGEEDEEEEGRILFLDRGGVGSRAAVGDGGEGWKSEVLCEIVGSTWSWLDKAWLYSKQKSTPTACKGKPNTAADDDLDPHQVIRATSGRFENTTSSSVRDRASVCSLPFACVSKPLTLTTCSHQTQAWQRRSHLYRTLCPTPRLTTRVVVSQS